MANNMQEIIKNLLASDVQFTEKGTQELNDSYNHPETIPALFDLMANEANETHIRLYSALLLSKRLGKLQHWQMVSPDIQQEIKSSILIKILDEKKSSMRTTMCRLLGVIIHHESVESDGWLDSILRSILEYCSSSDSNVCEIGSDVFAKLLNAVPEEFVPHIGAICQMFVAAMSAAEASGNVATPAVQNIIAGMKALVPFISGNNDAEQTYCDSIPYIVKTLSAMSKQRNVEMFRTTFEFLEVMLDHTPKLLSKSVEALMEFCMGLGKDATLDPVVRIQSVAFIGSLVCKHKIIIIKENLLEPTLGVIFELIASPSTNYEEGEYFLDSDTSGPKTTAAQTLDIIALNMPPERLLPPLLAILKPALQNNDPLKRMAAYVCIGIIAEDCSEAIRDEYLQPMLETIQKGTADTDVKVKSAAFYALGQFAEYMKPDIFEYADQILPILLHHLDQLRAEGRDEVYNMKPIERVFCVLCAYLEDLEEKVLTPYMPKLMEIVFKALEAENPPDLREFALQVIYFACNSVQDGILPYFERIVKFLQPYLEKSEQEHIVDLQPEVMDTLSALARSVGTENFMPLAAQATEFSVMMLETNEGNEDPEFRKSLYNLFSSLSIAINNELSPVFEKIIEPILDSVLPTDNVITEFKEDNIDASAGGDAGMDISNSDAIEDYNSANYSVDEINSEVKEVAIIALKEFATNSPEAFLPYVRKAFETIYNTVDHWHKSVRTICIKALAVFSLLLYKQNNQADVETAIKVLLPKLCQIVHDDVDCMVVIEALECIFIVLVEMKQAALPNEDVRNCIYNCIKAVLECKISCQLDIENDDDDDDNDDDSEMEERECDLYVFDCAANLLPSFGAAMKPEQFAVYFEGIAPLLLKHMNKKSASIDNNRRCVIYNVLAECFQPLGPHCKIYFDTLCPLLINGFSSTKGSITLMSCIYALGELVLHSEEKSFSEYPTIWQTLLNAISGEEHPRVLDNICDAIARLIVTNHSLVPFEQVLPVFFEHLRLRKINKHHNLMILKCLNILYVNALDAVEPMIGKFITFTVTSITDADDDKSENNEMVELGLNLLSAIQKKYPNEFASVMDSVPPKQNQKFQTLMQNRTNQ